MTVLILNVKISIFICADLYEYTNIQKMNFFNKKKEREIIEFDKSFMTNIILLLFLMMMLMIVYNIQNLN